MYKKLYIMRLQYHILQYISFLFNLKNKKPDLNLENVYVVLYL